jgi:predicted transcriptional regulator
VKRGKRSRLQMYFDILQLLRDQERSSGEMVITRIARRANMPYDRFKECLDSLVELNMVCRGSGGKLAVTEKGLEFVDEHQKVNDFLKRMGLSN